MSYVGDIKTDSKNTLKRLKSFFNISLLLIIFFSHIQKCLKIRQPSIIKKEQIQASKKDHERYLDPSEEEKNKKQEYGCGRYKNL